MKKIFLVLTSIILIFSLSACNTSNVDRTELFDYTTDIDVTPLNFNDYNDLSEAGLNDLLVKEGKLVVGTSPDFAPSSFLDVELTGINAVQGSESAIAFFVAKSLGLELEFKTVAFDGLTTELNNNSIDVVFSGLSYTVTRAENFDFTEQYHKSTPGNQVLITLKSNLNKYSLIDDINKSTVKIGFQEGSLQEALVKEQLENVQTGYVKNENVALELNKGTFDCVAYAKGSAELLVEANPELAVIESFVFDTSDYGTMGLLKKGNKIKAYLDAAIIELPEDQYATWREQFVEYAAAITYEPSSTFIGRVFQVASRYGLYFVKGTGITISLSLLTVIFGTMLGMVLLLCKKNSFKPLKYIGTAYIEVIRGVPLLLQLWVIYIISPASWPAFLSVCVALIINSGAYVSEIIRAGIDAIDKGQYEAARSLGLSKVQAMKKVVFPQAIKKISPALGNEFVMLIKETSLASVFFIGDLMTVKNTITSITYLTLEPYVVIAIIYFALTFTTSKVINSVEKKLDA